ncbi:MAG: hypothetical protein VX987_15490 [Pseudomonadota bacterium]|jgi:hypothetical protein|nr:hypothetical protein [Pseudomonadota bacterium]|tara:strand:- start:1294 stop:1956 length:663 start_codon:yes stop_codon:yes gene_type:complete
MSLKAALKAGLGAIDSQSSDGNNDFNKLNKPREFTGKLGALHSKGDVPEISAPEKKVVAKLSDSLPKPKLNIKTYAHAANVNKQENSTARVSTAQDNISLSGLDKTTKEKEVKPTITAQQYVSELDRFLNKQNEHLTKKVVLGVSSVEIERLVKLSAKVRGRYIAKLLDLGGDGHLVLKESELIDLRRTRESHEELLAGLNVLKNAISNGEIIVSGNLEN